MNKKFTFEEIEAITEEAMRNCLKQVDDDETIADYMQKSFNNGVRIMQKEMVIRLLMEEVKHDADC